MKKIVAVIALDETAAKFYESQVRELFGELVDTASYSVRGGTLNQLKRADLYAVSTDAFETPNDYGVYIPIDREVVEIGVTFTKAAMKMLWAIPKGSKALFVNLSEKMVMEAITRLNQLGINHITFTPYYPGASWIPDCELAVTPAESRYVPDTVKTVIDIGQRVLDANTIVEIALKLKLEYLLEDKKLKGYFKSIETNSYSIYELLGRFTRYESLFEILIELLDEGIIGINEEDCVFACNSKAAEITGVNCSEVLDRRADQAFPYMPFDECHNTLQRIDTRLIKLNGVDLNVTIAPVLRREKYVGAFATVQRFTEQESKQHSLRIQLMNKGHKAKYTFSSIIGESEALGQAVDIAAKMAKSNSSVLITGESGTGKELFAHAVHNASNRMNYPFVAINCAAMPDNLLESELFGYEDGAFTGAKRGGKLGLFEFAHKGSIFLDEVEGMSPALQVKLLRVIQEQEVMRVGGNKIISVDVRIIAATNERLEEMVAAGSFRKDLYYRLNTLPIQLPALRERKDDIMLLFYQFKKELGGTFTLDDEAVDALQNHRWDGNVRELRNYVEYFVCIDKQVITCKDLPPSFYKVLQNKSTGQAEGDETDYAAFMRMIGRRSDEYIFVLEAIEQARKDCVSIGRDSILAQAEEQSMPLSQREVRDILNNMEAMGFIKISKGRGGSKITSKGMTLLEKERNWSKMSKFNQ